MMNQKPPQKVRERFNKNYFEKRAWEGNTLVCGIDEVGRSPLAGPLVTAAAILPIGKTHRLLKDSKEMTHEERKRAERWIKKHCWYGYGIVHHRIITQHNIWHATLIAMKRALLNALAMCPEKPSAILIDAMPLQLHDTSCDIPVYYFNKGEKRSSSIAAASILAKEKRDAMMRRMEKVFPGYSFASNKGYGTKVHRQAIKQIDLTIVHRASFVKRFLTDSDEYEGQQSLFRSD